MTRKAKFYLYRVRLNRGGYTDTGYYYGVGRPLYCFVSADGADGACIRANDREAAKARVRARIIDGGFGHPTAEFYR
jgi:hypothetical protein